MTSEKSVAVEQRLNLLVPRVGTLESAAAPVTWDGWHDTSSLANSWGKSTGWFKYGKLTMAGTNWLYLSAKLLSPGTLADGTSLLVTSLASAYQPVTATRFTVYCDDMKAGVHSGPAEVSAFELRPDGSMVCYGIQATATRVDVNQLIPLDL